MAAVRMRDVAAEAQVSSATVSLVLSGDARISEATRLRVQEVVARLGYRPSAAARSLRTASSGSLGLILGDVANPFFGELAAATEREAARHGYTLVIGNADEDPAQQDRYLASLLGERRVDGVMVVSAHDVTPGLGKALTQGQRVVLVDRPIDPGCLAVGDVEMRRLVAACPLVRADGRGAIREAVAELAGLGHTRLGVIAGPLSTVVGRERRDAVVAAQRRLIAGGSVDVAEGDFRSESGERAMGQLLDGPTPPTAVFCSDALMTLGALRELKARGLRVPDDVSVVGYDDSPWFDLVDPGISTIAQPIERIGRNAVRLLLAADGGHVPHRLRCSYVRRNSCARPPEHRHRRPGRRGGTQLPAHQQDGGPPTPGDRAR